MEALDQTLVSICFEAVTDVAKWERVLNHMMHKTGAPAATITLRDGRTCQVIDDQELIEQFHSPLICGFPQEAAEYYLNELRVTDPWAKAQITNRPYRPTLMSTICEPSKVGDKRFIDWLNSLGISDTVVCQIGSVKGAWTACNLFVPFCDLDVGVFARQYLSDHLPVLTSAWKASRKNTETKQVGTAALAELSHLAIPSCVISTRGLLLAANKSFAELVDTGHVSVSGAEKLVTISEFAQVVNDEADFPRQLLSHKCELYDELIVSVRRFDPDPLFPRMVGVNWLLTFQSKSLENQVADRLYDRSRLSERQREMVDLVLSGERVKDAGSKVGLRRTQTFSEWKKIKQLLGFTSAHQLKM